MLYGNSPRNFRLRNEISEKYLFAPEFLAESSNGFHFHPHRNLRCTRRFAFSPSLRRRFLHSGAGFPCRMLEFPDPSSPKNGPCFRLAPAELKNRIFRLKKPTIVRIAESCFCDRFVAPEPFSVRNRQEIDLVAFTGDFQTKVVLHVDVVHRQMQIVSKNEFFLGKICQKNAFFCKKNRLYLPALCAIAMFGNFAFVFRKT